MEYTLSMVFLTENGLKTTLSINGVKPDMSKEQVDSLMDTILAKNIFLVDSGAFAKKVSAQLISRKVDKFEITK